MNTTAFTVYYEYKNTLDSVQIQPCCAEDNVVDYAVWSDEQLLFTMTHRLDIGRWVIALKNADDDFTDELVQLIGIQIEKKIADTSK